MLRAGRFRHRLLDDEFLKTQGPLASQCLKVFLPLWQCRQLRDEEMAAIYILIFAFLRRPKDFLGGPHGQTLSPITQTEGITCQEVLKLLRLALPENLRDAKSLNRLENTLSLMQLLSSVSLRSIPFSVTKSLASWWSGDYPLKLMTHIPTPQEVLTMQCTGYRCISMLIELDEITAFVDEGRDVLGFIVHDLIHADHFFADSEKAQAQIHFSRKLSHVHSRPDLQQMLRTDPAFEKEFHYLMSDMNSVPLHLLKTLKATLLGYFKRQQGLKMSAPLPETQETRFQALFASILEPWKFPPLALNAAQRLNTEQYQGLADSEMLHWALTRNLDDEMPNVC